MAASLFAPLVLHNLNQQQAMHRAVQAQSQGLDVTTYGSPFPGSTVTHNTTTNNSGGILRGALVGAMMLLAGGAGTVGVSKMLSPSQTPTPPVQPSGAGQTAKPAAWDAIIEQQQGDGSWKQIGQQHLQP